MGTITNLSLVRNTAPEFLDRPQIDDLHDLLSDQAIALADFAVDPRPRRGCGDELTFKAFEETLVPRVFALARTLVMLHLAAAEERVAAALPERVERGGRRFIRGRVQGRNLATSFGVVRYWRTYMKEEKSGGGRHGYYPLDLALGLMADRISMTLMALAVRLATKMSYAEARSTLEWFVPTAPSTEVVQQAVLGFGRYTGEWHEVMPVPEGDGEVLIIMIDSKAAPTATETELKRRRGPRRRSQPLASPRHRGRNKRQRHPKRPRRKKGDKSKNGKSATVVVMYTLRREGDLLVGPINKWVYASFAPKRHAFEMARRQAERRGFGDGSGKLVQLVTDGDDDLAFYAKEYFPDAMHTLDVMHAIEKLWSAGECIYREGSDQLKVWMEGVKELLYRGEVEAVIAEIWKHYLARPETGPGNKGKRQRLYGVARYLNKRVHQMNYDEIIAQDLEIGSGAVEGAVKYVVGRRCDHGGMRWIKERSEALLQLRCIELNGQWEAFMQYVHDGIQRRGSERCERIRLQQAQPEQLPVITTKAA